MKAPTEIYFTPNFLTEVDNVRISKSYNDDIKYLSEESVNEMLAEKDKIIEAKKNRIRILEKFIPKSDTNVVEDSSFKAIPTCKNCGNLFNDTDMKVIKSLPENVCSSCFTSNA